MLIPWEFSPQAVARYAWALPPACPPAGAEKGRSVQSPTAAGSRGPSEALWEQLGSWRGFGPPTMRFGMIFWMFLGISDGFLDDFFGN